MKRIIFLTIVATAMLLLTAASSTPQGMIGRFDIASPWGVIDDQDVIGIGLGFGKAPGIDAPRAWDLDYNGEINIADVGMVAARHNCTFADACYWR